MQDRPQDYEQARGKYIIDKETMKVLPASAVIMHPLPRVDEVSWVCPPEHVIVVAIVAQWKTPSEDSKVYLVSPDPLSW